MSTRKKTVFLAQFSLLLAIEAIFSFTPLGSLPAIGPIVATLGMLPIIVAALVLGTGAGSLMGFAAGLFSLIFWTFTPANPLIAFVFTPFYSIGSAGGNFWSLVICFVPRILVGTVTGLCFKGFSKAFPKKDFLRYGVSAALGSLVNTALVLGGIALFFGRDYTAALGLPYDILLLLVGSTILFSGLPEAVIGYFCGYFICRPIKTILGKTSIKN